MAEHPATLELLRAHGLLMEGESDPAGAGYAVPSVQAYLAVPTVQAYLAVPSVA